MKRFYRDMRLAIIVGIVAFGICWLAGHSFIGSAPEEYASHRWLHEQLNLTAEQDEKLIPIEKAFSERKQELEAVIYAANHELASAINADNSYSQRVKAAVDKIHHAQGELQKATLEHLFEMHRVLSPEQRKKLNALITDALTHKP